MAKAKILVVPPEKTEANAMPAGCSGPGNVRAYVQAEKFPLRCHEIRLAAGEDVTVGPVDGESIGYIWHGDAMAGGHRLPGGSSFVVERGEQLVISGESDRCDILLFAASETPQTARAGGHVHILPSASVPRNNALTPSGVSGGMHADSQCPTCSVWLHENGFPGMQAATPEEQSVAVHSHSEDEIIFVVSGEIRLGRKLYPEGTAIAIAADTLYSFTAGPEGMRFINFRAGLPADIHFANGNTMN
ncbi:MAG: hypothetical protein EOP21_09865, partial [Hyphomicrobiales bacterium]